MAHAETAPKGPIEIPPPHTDAYMDITLTMGVNWLAAMITFAAFGIIVGMLLKMGGAWIATVVGRCVLGVVIQALIWLGSALL